MTRRCSNEGIEAALRRRQVLATWGSVLGVAAGGVLLASAARPAVQENPQPSTTPVANVAPAVKGFNLLLVSIDTLRADHLGCYGYFRDTSPTLDALAKEAVLFRECHSPLARTTPTHASLLTALYPIEHGLTDNITHERNQLVLADPVLTYAEVARQAGYRTAAFVSAAPVKRDTGLNAGFEVWDEPDASQRSADETNAPFLRWLSSAAEGPPFFAWLHYFDPHTPYRPPADYADRFQTDDKLRAYMRERRFADEASKQHSDGPIKDAKSWNTEEAINRYDAEIRFADDQLARVFATLKAAGAWDRTVIVVTSDHGEGLGQHDWPNHGGYWQEQLHVPLIIRVPGTEARQVRTILSTVDILPTLLGMTDRLPKGELPSQASGRNVLVEQGESPSAYAQTPGDRGSTIRTLTTPRWRYIHRPGRGDLLFDRLADPHELNDVSSKHPDVIGAMRDELRNQLDRQSERQSRYGATRAPARKERVNELRELGYIDDEDPDATEEDEP
ncbi:MAG: sulfatase [Phycisphaerae bacterium]|nr:sulfatase [Planctomycetia bacterium]MCK6464440.1 sulfatase-like hydrolase/transferase [Phycisphaerae bacterium]MCL4718009.1 sulfatase [Phycisphaerae bacterium]NUQ07729.1 sulfatase [Phycisphaerae bacterium]